MSRSVVVGVNDLATVRPDLADELCDTSLGHELGVGSGRKVMWRCKLGHVWEATPNARSTNGQGCPYCSGRRVLVGFNDLATTHPDVAARLVNFDDAHAVSAGSGRKLRWRCEYGHEWDAVVKAVVKGSGCPYCSGRLPLLGVSDLATTHPDLVTELVDRELATRLSAGSGRRVRWRCEKGHEWVAPVIRRTRDGSGCPYCSGRIVVPGVTDIGTVDSHIADELVDQSLRFQLSAGSGRYVLWRCEHGHVWPARVAERCGTHRTKCPMCAGNGSSELESEVLHDIVLLLGDDVEVIRHDRTLIAPLELDIVVPSAHVAIEFNGLFWHSEDAGKDRLYHLRKRRACEAVGYQLIQIWQDDWCNRRGVVLSMLAHKFGVSRDEHIHARKLEIRRIEGREAAVFLDANHIQGSVSATMHVGGFFGGRLVAVLSIRDTAMSSRMRYAQGEWEIRRYATSCIVAGGFSRLLAHAERMVRESGQTLSRWVSISDCDVSDGRMYQECGFVRDAELAPDYRYWGNVTGNVRRPKESFQKRRFKECEDLLYEEGMTERELARLNGLHRVYDSGKIRWVKDVSA